MRVSVQLRSGALFKAARAALFFFIMFYVYILYSAKLNRYYTGSCESIEARLQRHNLGTVTSTRSGKPWELKYFEDFNTRQEALNRELQIKKMKSRAYIENLITRKGID